MGVWGGKWLLESQLVPVTVQQRWVQLLFLTTFTFLVLFRTEKGEGVEE